MNKKWRENQLKNERLKKPTLLKGKWGGKKSVETHARLRRVRIFCAWYDFEKCNKAIICALIGASWARVYDRERKNAHERKKSSGKTEFRLRNAWAHEWDSDWMNESEQMITIMLEIKLFPFTTREYVQSDTKMCSKVLASAQQDENLQQNSHACAFECGCFFVWNFVLRLLCQQFHWVWCHNCCHHCLEIA